LNILILNNLKYIILKEKVEKVFIKYPKNALKSAVPVLFAAPLYIVPTVVRQLFISQIRAGNLFDLSQRLFKSHL
jgi:hypothetical protein